MQERILAAALSANVFVCLLQAQQNFRLRDWQSTSNTDLRVCRNHIMPCWLRAVFLRLQAARNCLGDIIYIYWRRVQVCDCMSQPTYLGAPWQPAERACPLRIDLTFNHLHCAEAH